MLTPALAALHIVSLALAAPAAFVLNSELNVWDVSSHDLNGDQRADLLVLASDEKSAPLRKSIAIHLAQEDGSYASSPSFVLPLPPESGAAFLSEMDGAPPADLVVVNAEGACIYQFQNNALELRSTVPFNSLFPSGAKRPSFLRNVSADLDGDGRDEWIVPVPLGVEIRRAETRVARVSCDVASEIGGGNSLFVSHRIPALYTFSMEGSHRKGLAFLSDEFADFAHGEDWSRHERFRIPVNLEEKWEADSKMADINKDNLPDLMVTQTRGTVNLQVLTQVYLAQAPFTYPDDPTATFQAQGSIANGLLVDVDGDEMLDMVYIRVPFGVRNVMNFMLRGMVHVEADVYLFKDGKFQPEPQFQEGLTIAAPEGREQVAHAMADFNGDGRLDLALATQRDQLSIFTGSPDRFLSKKPWQVMNVPSFGEAKSYKLNEGAADDIVICHTSGEHQKRVEVLLF